MACLQQLEYDSSAKQFVGKDPKTGQTRAFQSLAGYEAYVSSIKGGCPEPPQPEAKPLQKHPRGTTFTPTGFLEFSPRDAQTQMRYDAMQPEWEGIQASESAITRGLYDLDTVWRPQKNSRGGK